MAQIKKEGLLSLLKKVDEKLSKKITLTAVGGTALTLLNSKDSTKDIDFDLNKEDYQEFKKILEEIPHGFKIDLFEGGFIFSQQLPSDYEEKTIAIKEPEFNKIELKTLSPVDIVASKIGRLSTADEEDIKTTIKKFKLTKKQIIKRTKQIEYAGYEKTYEINLKALLKTIK
ncbi:MAG: DUF6036 family nucleotidyltransferase [Candidatus Diapherotrites archaeon]